MSWNIGFNRNLFLKLKSNLGLYHIVLTTATTSPERPTLTVIEMQQMQNIENTDSKEEICCLKLTVYNGRQKVCENFNTDTDKLNIVVYRYRINFYLEDEEIDLKLKKYQSIAAKRVYLLRCSLSNEPFPVVPGITKVICAQLCSQKWSSKWMFLLGFWKFFTWEGPKT